VAGLSHGATTFQAARFYCALAKGELVSPDSTRLMRSALSKPGLDHKFVKGLSAYDGLDLYRKSGSWKQFHADSMLVETQGGGAYVLVALAKDPAGSAWLEDLAAPLHRLALSLD
jgi:beta-lactamase class A